MSNKVECFEIYPTENFNKDIKYYTKKKRYKKIFKDIQPILEDLEQGIFVGDEIADLKIGNDNKTYKVRAVNSDTNEGKSNGYRVIYYVEMENKVIFLMTVYHKKDEERIPSKKEISDLIKELIEE
ncbi:TPA: hypothetical protein K8N08_001321 [Clostridium perfringens]|uniref:hypothetical protein n=1 Tax=Clostridium perfringens TaxID=1502 RepID=UPI0018E4A952|nr:hypothetical protein [Clostridium perfringens]MDU3583794.1 hypothetical protein [Clostridium butyricum]ELC8402643.1 hypothetical protein [Clostridium perfringens]MBI6111774.1 hypothetical protein [Clostridium perfringens]MBI6114836.1 hypothetical protein [Clostridium perfringens]MDH5078425.1 hypothetical protein [Clostridium perfringens]